jgi:CRISPR-associated protein Csb2
MLAFEVEFLMGRVFAGSHLQRSEVEWPPHPGRFFSALVAAAKHPDAPDDAEDALRWLEEQYPPEISASLADQGEPYSGFVPVNYTTGGIFNKQSRTFPAATPRDSVVHFIWSKAEPSEGHRMVLGDLAARVGYLGKASSPVRAALCTEPPPASTHVPMSGGEDEIRVPGPGRLAELETAYANNIRVLTSPVQPYQALTRRTTTPQSDFGPMIVFRRVQGPALPIEATLGATECLRKAMIRIAENHNLKCQAIHGHEEGPHCAYVALPYAGPTYGDGRIMGLAMVLPRDLKPDERRKVRATAFLLRRLRLPADTEWEVECEGENWPQTLHPNSWQGPARRWVTVTPILLDRFPKKGKLTVEEVIEESVRRIGIEERPEIATSSFPFLKGVAPARSFRLTRAGKERVSEWVVHADITFAKKARGPILLGRGRYFGMGLMKPVALPVSGEEGSGDAD